MLRGFLFAWLSAGCSLFASLDGLSGDAVRAADEGVAVEGTVVGLDGQSVTLVLNGSNPIEVHDGPFAFASRLPAGASYVVTVLNDPPSHVCAVERGTGTIAAGTKTGVVVTCPSINATLKELTLSLGPLSPSFTSARLNYTAGPFKASIFPEAVPTTATLSAVPTSASARIAIAGAEVAAGAPSPPVRLVSGVNAIDVTVTAADGASQVHYKVDVSTRPSDYVKASNTRQGAKFGASTALSANTLAVGAPSESSGATGVNGDESDTSRPNAGAVYVYAKSGTTWSKQAYIKASNTDFGAEFGTAVALSGDTLVVGAPGEATYSGAVYVYTRTGETWSQQAYLKASNARPGAIFGASVAIDGDTLIVGSPNESSNATLVNGNEADTSMTESGAAYVYTRSGSTWTKQAYLKASNPRFETYFGASVAISGNTVVVGSPTENSEARLIGGDDSNTFAPGSGAAYVFTRSGSAWSLRQSFEHEGRRRVRGIGRALGRHLGGWFALRG